MKLQTSRVMIFANQNCAYTFSDSFDYNWRADPLIVKDSESDLEKCPIEWPKNCQISPTEWLFFGGKELELGTIELTGEQMAQPMSLQIPVGSKQVLKLDTMSHRLAKVETEMPTMKCAHQVIYIPAK